MQHTKQSSIDACEQTAKENTNNESVPLSIISCFNPSSSRIPESSHTTETPVSKHRHNSSREKLQDIYLLTNDRKPTTLDVNHSPSERKRDQESSQATNSPEYCYLPTANRNIQFLKPTDMDNSSTVNENISPTQTTSRSRLKHQNSSPLSYPCRSQNSEYGTSFLSNLAASRPAAARGLLGVASAALAASRAGILAADTHRPSASLEGSNCMLPRHSEDLRIDGSHGFGHFCSPNAIQHEQMHTIGFICVNQLCDVKLKEDGHSRDQLPRRNSDSLLSAELPREGHSTNVPIILCNRCTSIGLHKPQGFQHFAFSKPCLFCGSRTVSINDSNLCPNRYSVNTSEDNCAASQKAGWSVEKSDLHYSLGNLSDNLMDPGQADRLVIPSNRATSSTLPTSAFRHELGGCGHGIFCEDVHLHYYPVCLPNNQPTRAWRKSSQAAGGSGVASISGMVSTTAPPPPSAAAAAATTSATTSATRQTKRTGLDSIGLDFIYIKSGRPGLPQLRHVKEFKAAKEQENQHHHQQQQTEDPVSKLKVFKSNALTTGFGLLPTSGSPHGTSSGNLFQSSPFHQLVTGGVLGATVLAMASKDRSNGRDAKLVLADRYQAAGVKRINRTKKASSGEPAAFSATTEQKKGSAHSLYADKSKQSSSQLVVGPYSAADYPHPTRGTADLRSNSAVGKKLSDRLNSLRANLTRSVTVGMTCQEESHIISVTEPLVRFQEIASAPGLSRAPTVDGDEHRTLLQAEWNCEKPLNWLMENQADEAYHRVDDSFNSSSQVSGDGIDSTICLQNRINDLTDKTVRNDQANETMAFKDSSADGMVQVNHHRSGSSGSLTGLQSRIRRRRANFKRGRSSTFVWTASHPIGETGEGQLEENPQFPENRKNPIQEDEKQGYQTETSKLSGHAKIQFFEEEEEAATRFREKSPVNIVTDINSNSQSYNYAPEIQMDDEGHQIKTTESLHEMNETTTIHVPFLQQRRDAMINQHQQRTIRNVGYRLGKRKRLFEKRCRISDLALLFALFGISVMLLETELTFANVYTKNSIYSYLNKSLITVSTLVLMGLILAYHVYVIKIFSSDDSIEDWRMAMDRNRVCQIALELFVCGIHPFPGCSFIQFPLPSTFVGPSSSLYSSNYHGPPASLQYLDDVSINRKLEDNQNGVSSTSPRSTAPTSLSENNMSTQNPTPFPNRAFSQPAYNPTVCIDLLLSVPMFLRLYLLLRVMLLHSKLFTDAGSRSIGAMNKVSFDMRFIFKTLMTMCPGRLLLAFVLCLWIVFSWILRYCESYYVGEQGTLPNSLWLIAVTFLSIGYGDIVPLSYCGRTIALTTGVMGCGCTALIVAVFARKLELSKAEKHVIHFMMENQVNKTVKHYAANVLRETWLIYKYTKLARKVEASRVRKHQRKFLKAIHGLRRMKLDQRKIQDSANALVDLAKTQANIYETIDELRLEHRCITHRMESLEVTMHKLQDQLKTLPSLLRTTMVQQHYALQKFAPGRPMETSVAAIPSTAPGEQKHLLA